MAVQEFAIDPAHSTISFLARHLVVSKVRGRFTKWTGKLALDLDDLSNSTVTAEIDIASVDTQAGDRDTQLRSADFFDVAKYPSATFRSTRFERVSADRYRVYGDLVIRGVSKPVVLDAEYTGQSKNPWGEQVVRFSASGTINRTDWGLAWNKSLEAGGVLVGDKIKIEVEIKASAAK